MEHYMSSWFLLPTCAWANCWIQWQMPTILLSLMATAKVSWILPTSLSHLNVLYTNNIIFKLLGATVMFVHETIRIMKLCHYLACTFPSSYTEHCTLTIPSLCQLSLPFIHSTKCTCVPLFEWYMYFSRQVFKQTQWNSYRSLFCCWNWIHTRPNKRPTTIMTHSYSICTFYTGASVVWLIATTPSIHQGCLFNT